MAKSITVYRNPPNKTAAIIDARLQVASDGMPQPSFEIAKGDSDSFGDNSSSSGSGDSSSTSVGLPVVGRGCTKKYTKTTCRVPSIEQPVAKTRPSAIKRTTSQPVAASAKRARH